MWIRGTVRREKEKGGWRMAGEWGTAKTSVRITAISCRLAWGSMHTHANNRKPGLLAEREFHETHANQATLAINVTSGRCPDCHFETQKCGSGVG